MFLRAKIIIIIIFFLIDRLRMYYNVGAACGRIHPTGMGK